VHVGAAVLDGQVSRTVSEEVTWGVTVLPAGITRSRKTRFPVEVPRW
jgi:hypothetical protein